MRGLKITIIIVLLLVFSVGIFILDNNCKDKETIISFYKPYGEVPYLVKNYKDGSACNEPFRIVTFTDTHFSGKMDKASDRASYTLIENTILQEQPDLVVICGDIVLGEDAQIGATILSELFEEHNQYWGFVLGNHDGEHENGPSRAELVDIYTSYPHCIISSTPDIWGDGNCIVNIRDSKGWVIQSLVFIDSGDYLKEEFCSEYGFAYKNAYDFIKYDQIQWYKDEMNAIAKTNGSMPSSIMFIHIPLFEYKEAYNKANKQDAIFYGMRRENECSAPYNTGMFDAILELGSTKAVVCGHDHINDYCVDYQGVKLLYSQSSSFGSYYMRSNLLYAGMYIANKKNDRFSDGHTLFKVAIDSSLTITPLLNQDNPSIFNKLTAAEKEELWLDNTLPRD